MRGHLLRMLCNDTKYIGLYVCIMIYIHNKYIRLNVLSRALNHTKKSQIHKIVQIYDQHSRTKINLTETNVDRR